MKRTSVFVALAVAMLLGLSEARAQVSTVVYSLVYVTNSGSNTVSVIDTTLNSIVATINVGPAPAGIVFNPTGTRAYVAVSSLNPTPGSGTVAVIDTGTNQVIANVALPPSTIVVAGLTLPNRPQNVAITPDGTRVYMTDDGARDVAVIDTATNTVVATIGYPTDCDACIPPAPEGVAISPDGKQAYITYPGAPSLAVVDTATNSNFTFVPGVASPLAVAFTPDGTRAYVTSSLNHSDVVQVIDTSTLSVSAEFTTPAPNFWVAISPDGTRAYVTTQQVLEGQDLGGQDMFTVADTTTNSVVATVPAGLGFGQVALTSDGILAYVAGYYDGTVSAIGTPSNTVAGTVTGFNAPLGVAVLPTVSFSNFTPKVQSFSGTSSGIDFKATFVQGPINPGPLNPVAQRVAVRVGSYFVSIPPGSFKLGSKGTFTYQGTIDGVPLQSRLSPTGANSYSFQLEATGVSPTNTGILGLMIGNNSGATASQ